MGERNMMNNHAWGKYSIGGGEGGTTCFLPDNSPTLKTIIDSIDEKYTGSYNLIIPLDEKALLRPGAAAGEFSRHAVRWRAGEEEVLFLASAGWRGAEAVRLGSMLFPDHCPLAVAAGGGFVRVPCALRLKILHIRVLTNKNTIITISINNIEMHMCPAGIPAD